MSLQTACRSLRVASPQIKARICTLDVQSARQLSTISIAQAIPERNEPVLRDAIMDKLWALGEASRTAAIHTPSSTTSTTPPSSESSTSHAANISRNPPLGTLVFDPRAAPRWTD
ncbi:hypothetical protein B0I35DRAFT_444761 [Stachybotrys elegans]|uniref:Uncharacterized protein n=1 Tax=Stachybotrys elegans TaxID=80388 RepID=A0A8K0SII1_9HYPO|nr:hypothetical protein B0I35DRAFT_444761 [Stachybotrys elegans]